MRKTCIAAAFATACIFGSAHAEDAESTKASKPPLNPEPAPIVLTLTPTEAADLLAILDIAIKASGYSPMTLKALRIGQKLEQAGAGR